VLSLSGTSGLRSGILLGLLDPEDEGNMLLKNMITTYQLT
jgi:hypothetical protein